MTLYETWVKAAYDSKGNSDKKFWTKYMPLEQRIYEDILGKKITKLDVDFKEFAWQYSMRPEYVCGFIDGIKDALDNEIKIEELTIDMSVELEINFEKLFKKMVEYKAKHLYTLPQWQNIYTVDEMEKMQIEQRKSGIFVRGEKIGRNDACPCGSGKKYKKCCGVAAE